MIESDNISPMSSDFEQTKKFYATDALRIKRKREWIFTS